MRTREFINGLSCFQKLLSSDYRKVCHVNGNTAALFFYIKDSRGKWIPWTGTDYRPLTNLPNFIKRHINEEFMREYLDSNENRIKNPFGLYFENGKLSTI
jgi:hypothetical protein